MRATATPAVAGVGVVLPTPLATFTPGPTPTPRPLGGVATATPLPAATPVPTHTGLVGQAPSWAKTVVVGALFAGVVAALAAAYYRRLYAEWRARVNAWFVALRQQQDEAEAAAAQEAAAAPGLDPWEEEADEGHPEVRGGFAVLSAASSPTIPPPPPEGTPEYREWEEQYAHLRPDVRAEEARIQAEIAQQEAAQQAGHAAPLPLDDMSFTESLSKPPRTSDPLDLVIPSQKVTKWRISNPDLANRLSRIAFVLDLVSLLLSATGSLAEIATIVAGGVTGGIVGAVAGAALGFTAYQPLNQMETVLGWLSFFFVTLSDIFAGNTFVSREENKLCLYIGQDTIVAFGAAIGGLTPEPLSDTMFNGGIVYYDIQRLFFNSPTLYNMKICSLNVQIGSQEEIYP